MIKCEFNLKGYKNSTEVVGNFREICHDLMMINSEVIEILVSKAKTVDGKNVDKEEIMDFVANGTKGFWKFKEKTDELSDDIKDIITNLSKEDVEDMAKVIKSITSLIKEIEEEIEEEKGEN